MIIDTSALICVLRAEPLADDCLKLIGSDPMPRMSAATYVELAIVIERKLNPILSEQLDGILDDLRIHIESVTSSQAVLARTAYRNFGKGTGHPAQLNFGDCFSYALAKERGEPLLFIGDDFSHTDLFPAR